MNIRVAKGTNAGWKKPLQPRKEPWRCVCPSPTVGATAGPWVPENAVAPADDCFKLNPGWLLSCGSCKMTRP